MKTLRIAFFTIREIVKQRKSLACFTPREIWRLFAESETKKIIRRFRLKQSDGLHGAQVCIENDGDLSYWTRECKRTGHELVFSYHVNDMYNLGIDEYDVYQVVPHTAESEAKRAARRSSVRRSCSPRAFALSRRGRWNTGRGASDAHILAIRATPRTQ